jgi:hypothetical protein
MIRRRDVAVIVTALALGYFLLAIVGHAAYMQITTSLRALTSR